MVYFLLSTFINISDISLGGKANVNALINLIAYSSFIICYIKIYNKEKLVSNKYYTAFLNVWLGVAIILPLLQLLTRLLFSFTNIPVENMGVSFMYLTILGQFANVILLFFCIIVARCILNKSSIKYLAGLMIIDSNL